LALKIGEQLFQLRQANFLNALYFLGFIGVCLNLLLEFIDFNCQLFFLNHVVARLTFSKESFFQTILQFLDNYFLTLDNLIQFTFALCLVIESVDRCFHLIPRSLNFGKVAFLFFQHFQVRFYLL
jgi:hypothetical protein